MGEIRDTSQIGQAQHASADPATLESVSYEYDVFISYRRRDATRLARWIRDRIQHYKLPRKVLEKLPPEKKAVHERRPRVWLDKAFEKPSDDFLTKKIYPALDRSARLIVISTPSVFDNIRGEGDTKEPNWLEREIDRFLGGARANTSPRPIDVVLGPGGLEDRFPGRLAERKRWDWIDCRLFNWWRSWGLSEELDAGLTKLVAGLYDVPETQLPELRQEEQRRRNSLLRGISILALAVIVIIGLLGLNVWQQKKQVELNLANSLGRNSLSLSNSNQEFDALVEGIKAGKMIQRQKRTDAVITSALDQAVHGVRERNRLTRHTGWVTSVAFSPNGKTIATASSDTTIKLWNVEGKESQTLRGHTDELTSIAFSPDGKTIASASQDATVKLWKRNNTGHFETQPYQTLRGHTEWVTSIAFSPRDGEILASASLDGTIKLWKRNNTGHFETRPQTLCRDNVWFHNIVFSPDGQMLASARQEVNVMHGQVYLWKRDRTGYSRTKPSQILEDEGKTGAVQSVAFSPDGETIATANEFQTVTLWKRNSTGHFEIPPYQTLRGHRGWVQSVAFSPRDGEILASASQDRTVKLWTLRKKENEPQKLTGHKQWVWSVAFSPNGKTIATASGDETIKLWNLEGKESQTFEDVQSWSPTVAFSPDKRMQILAWASQDKTVKLWNLEGKESQTLRGHTNELTSIAFSPRDGEILASASLDGTIKLWKRNNTGHFETQPYQTLRGHTGELTSIAFSPRDGEILASASHDTTIKLWKRNNTGHFETQPYQTLRGHTKWVTSIAFSPDGKTIASASQDATVKLWNLQGEELQTLYNPFHTEQSWFRSVAFSPNGKTIAAGGSLDMTILWRNLDELRLNRLMVTGCAWLWDYRMSSQNQELEKNCKESRP